MRAIKKSWKVNGKEGSDLNNYQFYKSLQKPSSILYRNTIANAEILNKLTEKCGKNWGIEINEEFTTKYKSNVIAIPKVSISSKLRSFQYRLLTNAILTNNRLYYLGVKETQLCDFCKATIETCKHLFYDCPKIRPLWEYI